MYKVKTTLAFMALFALCALGQTAMAENAVPTIDDLPTKKVSAIGEVTTTISTDQWYLLEQERGGSSPAYDAGEEAVIMRAATEGAVTVGSYKVQQYLLRFVATDSTSHNKQGSTVYKLQWGTGRYWVNSTANPTSSSTEESAGLWNVYRIGETNYIGINKFDMGSKVDNNGIGNTLTFWESGEITGESGNNHWRIRPVTLADLDEDDYAAMALEGLRADMLPVLRQAQATYEANTEWTYDTQNKLITDASQLSSPFTDGGESIGLPGLIDGNPDTYWHSTWGGGAVEDDKHYFQVTMPEDFDGGELIAYIHRRGDTYNNHVTAMAVKTVLEDASQERATGRAADTENVQVLAILEYPYSADGEELTAHFTCPKGVKTLRFYEERTAGVSGDNGYFHLAEFQLYAATMSPTCLNGYNTSAATALTDAITVAGTAYKEGTLTEDSKPTLLAAIETYSTDIMKVHFCEAEEGEYDETLRLYKPAHWTAEPELDASLFHISPWSTGQEEPGGESAKCVEYKTDEGTLADVTITHTSLTGLPAGTYAVSLDARLIAEQEVEGIREGTTLKVNGDVLDLVDAGTEFSGTTPDISGDLPTVVDVEGETGDATQPDEDITTEVTPEPGTGTETGGYTKTVVYGTYTLYCDVEAGGTIDVSLSVKDANYNWLAFRNLAVELTTTLPELPAAAEGVMNATVAAEQASAIEAFNASQTVHNRNVAIEAIGRAHHSVAYYQKVDAAFTSALTSLDEAGKAVLTQSAIYQAYEARTLLEEEVIPTIVEAYKGQTTVNSDLTFALVHSGEWAATQGVGPTANETYPAAMQTYKAEGTFSEGKVLSKTIDGLLAGTYELTVYAVANNIEKTSRATGDGVAQLYVTGAEEATALTLGTEETFTLSEHSYTLTANVGEDGVLEFGMENLMEGGNLYVMQAVSLTLTELDYTKLVTEYEEVLAAAKALSANVQLPAEAKEVFDEALAADTLDRVTHHTATEIAEAIAALREAMSAAQAAIDALLTDYTTVLAEAEAMAQDEDLDDEAKAKLVTAIEENTLTLEEATAEEIATATQALMEAVAEAESSKVQEPEEEPGDESGDESGDENDEAHSQLVQAYGEALAAAVAEELALEEAIYASESEEGKAIMREAQTALVSVLTMYTYLAPEEEEDATLEAAIDALTAAVEQVRQAIATGIVSVSTTKQAGTVYTLGGVRMSGKPKAGIYIIDGKKVVVK